MLPQAEASVCGSIFVLNGIGKGYLFVIDTVIGSLLGDVDIMRMAFF